MNPSDTDTLGSLSPEVAGKIRRTLVDHETAYQRESGDAEYSSLWTHSVRVGRIAQYLAEKEGMDPTAALLAGLLHDMGKFADGKYHKDDVAEEEAAAEAVGRFLAGTPYEAAIGSIREAILSLYREDVAANDLGRVVYDADRLDKMGCMGVAQFFAKNALRRHFLDSELMVRASVELTYARHAQDSLKTATGRELALERSEKTRRFYEGLLEEWEELGLGSFSIWEESIEGIECVLVVPRTCPCGGKLAVDSDIRESVKCRSAVVQYRCTGCGQVKEFSFCMPNVQGLPRRHERQD